MPFTLWGLWLSPLGSSDKAMRGCGKQCP